MKICNVLYATMIVFSANLHSSTDGYEDKNAINNLFVKLEQEEKKYFDPALSVDVFFKFLRVSPDDMQSEQALLQKKNFNEEVFHSESSIGIANQIYDLINKYQKRDRSVMLSLVYHKEKEVS